jgi:hypothetical protein
MSVRSDRGSNGVFLLSGNHGRIENAVSYHSYILMWHMLFTSSFSFLQRDMLWLWDFKLYVGYLTDEVDSRVGW